MGATPGTRWPPRYSGHERARSAPWVENPRDQAKAAAVGSQVASFGLGRIGEPADTAALVAFLASPDAGFITGQVIYNAGGQRGPIRWSG